MTTEDLTDATLKAFDWLARLAEGVEDDALLHAAGWKGVGAAVGVVLFEISESYGTSEDATINTVIGQARAMDPGLVNADEIGLFLICAWSTLKRPLDPPPTFNTMADALLVAFQELRAAWKLDGVPTAAALKLEAQARLDRIEGSDA